MHTKTTPTHHQTPIRLLVVDDHPIVRQGIITIVQLQRDMTIVAEAGDGLEAIRLIKEHLPDIVLLDLRMPRMDGLDVIAELQSAKLPSKVIVTTTSNSENDVRCSIKAGARGYLLKDSAHQAIIEAIRRVSLGEIYLPPGIVQKVTEGMRNPELTRRELEILSSLAAGNSNKEIGAHLFIAEGTVKAHVKSLMEKLGTTGRSRMAAVIEAAHRGFVRLD